MGRGLIGFLGEFTGLSAPKIPKTVAGRAGNAIFGNFSGALAGTRLQNFGRGLNMAKTGVVGVSGLNAASAGADAVKEATSARNAGLQDAANGNLISREEAAREMKKSILPQLGRATIDRVMGKTAESEAEKFGRMAGNYPDSPDFDGLKGQATSALRQAGLDTAIDKFRVNVKDRFVDNPTWNVKALRVLSPGLSAAEYVGARSAGLEKEEMAGRALERAGNLSGIALDSGAGALKGTARFQDLKKLITGAGEKIDAVSTPAIDKAKGSASAVSEFVKKLTPAVLSGLSGRMSAASMVDKPGRGVDLWTRMVMQDTL